MIALTWSVVPSNDRLSSTKTACASCVPRVCLCGGDANHRAADLSGACCSAGTAVNAATGLCCPAGAVTDASGRCCTGTVDACGVCNGTGVAIDVLGTCCATRLTAAGTCCAGAHVDDCGVCGGANECIAKVSTTVVLLGTADVTALTAALSAIVGRGVSNVTVTLHAGATHRALVASYHYDVWFVLSGLDSASLISRMIDSASNSTLAAAVQFTGDIGVSHLPGKQTTTHPRRAVSFLSVRAELFVVQRWVTSCSARFHAAPLLCPPPCSPTTCAQPSPCPLPCDSVWQRQV